MKTVSFHCAASTQKFIRDVKLHKSEYQTVSATCILLIEDLLSYAENNPCVYQVR